MIVINIWHVQFNITQKGESLILPQKQNFCAGINSSFREMLNHVFTTTTAALF